MKQHLVNSRVANDSRDFGKIARLFYAIFAFTWRKAFAVCDLFPFFSVSLPTV